MANITCSGKTFEDVIALEKALVAYADGDAGLDAAVGLLWRFGWLHQEEFRRMITVEPDGTAWIDWGQVVESSLELPMEDAAYTALDIAASLAGAKAVDLAAALRDLSALDRMQVKPAFDWAFHTEIGVPR